MFNGIVIFSKEDLLLYIITLGLLHTLDLASFKEVDALHVFYEKVFYKTVVLDYQKI